MKPDALCLNMREVRHSLVLVFTQILLKLRTRRVNYTEIKREREWVERREKNGEKKGEEEK